MDDAWIDQMLIDEYESDAPAYGDTLDDDASETPTICGRTEEMLQWSRHHIEEIETVADRAERLAARHTRYDGSPQ